MKLINKIHNMFESNKYLCGDCGSHNWFNTIKNNNHNEWCCIDCDSNNKPILKIFYESEVTK